MFGGSGRREEGGGVHVFRGVRSRDACQTVGWKAAPQQMIAQKLWKPEH